MGDNVKSDNVESIMASLKATEAELELCDETLDNKYQSWRDAAERVDEEIAKILQGAEAVATKAENLNLMAQNETNIETLVDGKTRLETLIELMETWKTALKDIEKDFTSNWTDGFLDRTKASRQAIANRIQTLEDEENDRSLIESRRSGQVVGEVEDNEDPIKEEV